MILIIHLEKKGKGVALLRSPNEREKDLKHKRFLHSRNLEKAKNLYGVLNFKDKEVDYSLNELNNSESISIHGKVIVTVMNHLVEVQHMEKMNTKQHIQNLPRDLETGQKRYALLSTGEIFDCKESQSRQDNINSLRKTFKSMRYLINNNFQGNANELHVTLTYKENMTDNEQLMKDFEKFIKKLRYKHKKKGIVIEYINVVEPQERGAWHCHLLLRFDNLEHAYLDPKETAELWGHGFIKIKSLKGIDNIGAYLSAYLTDIEVKGEDLKNIDVVIKNVDGKPKKFVKGGRLHYYDVGMNIYRKSQGIIKPTRENMNFKDIKKIVGLNEPHYIKKIDVENDDFKNTITYLQYNLKRK